jgi:hypothetical protein
MILFGNFGATGSINGQVVKTREISSLLRAMGYEFTVFDTSSQSLISMVIATAKKSSDQHIVCLGKKGLLIYLLSSFIFGEPTKRRVFIAVGGWLPEYLNSLFVRMLIRNLGENSIFLVESNSIASHLMSLGFAAKIIANFRTDLGMGCLSLKSDLRPLKLLFLSRLIPEKGVFEAIKLVRELNARDFTTYLNIFGVGTPAEIERIQREIAADDSINFCGSVSPSNVAKLIGEYHFLILPTRYSGECMPGVVVEAFASGTPVLTTDWRYMSEMVAHNSTGAVFAIDNFRDSSIDWLLNLSAEMYTEMQLASLQEYRSRFSIESASAVLKSSIFVQDS